MSAGIEVLRRHSGFHFESREAIYEISVEKK